MKQCALCDSSTSPKNGSRTSSDAVLCPVHLALYEASSECRREKYFKSVGNEHAARVALTDFIDTSIKIRGVEEHKARNEASLRAAEEKKLTDAAMGIPPTAKA